MTIINLKKVMMRMYRQAVVCVNKNIYHDLRHRKMIRTYDIYHDMGVFIDLCLFKLF